MRYKNTILLLVVMFLFSGISMAQTQKWVRTTAPYTVKSIPVDVVIEKTNEVTPSIGLELISQASKMYMTDIVPNTIMVQTRGETLVEIVKKIAHPKMTQKEMWFLSQEIKFLNTDKMENTIFFKKSSKLTLPIYRPFESNNRCCSDMRNIFVAVVKGEKYGVHWAYMIGVRSQENPSPSRDHYAYGVVAKKGTNLWTQAEWGAKILKRVTHNAIHPSLGAIQSASLKYVGYSAPDWVSNVWAVYKRCQGVR